MLVFVIEAFMVSWLVVFYGISTSVSHLMPNPVYTYISNIFDLLTTSF